MTAPWSPDEYARLVEATRSRRAAIVKALAETLETTCYRCGRQVTRKGYVAPGGIPIIMRTCPHCDTYRLEDDK